MALHLDQPGKFTTAISSMKRGAVEMVHRSRHMPRTVNTAESHRCGSQFPEVMSLLFLCYMDIVQYLYTQRIVWLSPFIRKIPLYARWWVTQKLQPVRMQWINIMWNALPCGNTHITLIPPLLPTHSYYSGTVEEEGAERLQSQRLGWIRAKQYVPTMASYCPHELTVAVATHTKSSQLLFSHGVGRRSWAPLPPSQKL